MWEARFTTKMKKTNKPALELIKDSMKKDISKPLNFNNLSIKKIIIGDWKSFFIFIVLMFLIWSYVNDTRECRALIENIDEVCTEYLNTQTQINSPQVNLNEEYPDVRGITRRSYQQEVSCSIPPNS